MRRSPWFRTLASILALWFPLIAGEPGVLQPCPMHGAGPAIARSMGLTDAATASAGQMHHAAHRTPARGGQMPGHSQHDCTCVNCGALSIVLRAPDAPALATANVVFAPLAAVPNVQSLPRPAPEYSRPYTTGPPRV